MAGGVLIVAEHLERRIALSTLELIATARPLSRALGDERNARIAVLGHGVREIASHLAGYTLDVLLLDHPALAEYTGDGYVQSWNQQTYVLLHAPQKQEIDQSTADNIVSAGRAIQKKENLA